MTRKTNTGIEHVGPGGVASAPTGCLDRFESAKYLSISTRLLDDLAAQGKLPRVKITKRKTLFRVADLDAFVNSKVQRLSHRQEGEI